MDNKKSFCYRNILIVITLTHLQCTVQSLSMKIPGSNEKSKSILVPPAGVGESYLSLLENILTIGFGVL